MPAARILTQAQAEAVYSAMCTLNNVGGRLSCIDLGQQARDPQIRVPVGGSIIIERGVPHCDREAHDNQAAFATAYGLDHGGEPAPSSYAGMFGTSGNMPKATI